MDQNVETIIYRYKHRDLITNCLNQLQDVTISIRQILHTITYIESDELSLRICKVCKSARLSHRSIDRNIFYHQCDGCLYHTTYIRYKQKQASLKYYECFQTIIGIVLLFLQLIIVNFY